MMAAATSSRTLAVAAQLELIVAGAVLLALAGLLLARELRRWRRAHPPQSDETRARAVMGELCPNGWQAQITLFDSSSARPPATLRRDGQAVSLDWCEIPEPGGEPPLMRRVWAPTIAQALGAMVDDRRTDEVLERIERAALADDDPWDAV